MDQMPGLKEWKTTTILRMRTTQGRKSRSLDIDFLPPDRKHDAYTTEGVSGGGEDKVRDGKGDRL